ncbi:D-alanyl-D-alanine carboxypeptidase [Rhizobiaceae bacterium]|nr:D-alanyl-D-alanine carboxypeptidase [Rhizobiaceae bacterium]
MRTVFGSTSATGFRDVFSRAVKATAAAALLLAAGTATAAANSKYAAIVVDAKTGKTLHSSSADATRYPASLTKMMTLYLVFEDLKSGRIDLDDRVEMTRAGTRRPPSKLGMRAGSTLSLDQAIRALVTKSANDVATALGDNLSGSEAKFARRMTLKAKQLGMNNTTFKNASGLTERGQTTTARDMATLGIALREHFPRRYSYFQTRSFKFGKAKYGNHNKLLGRVKGVDGIKTGYTNASGFNLVTSVQKDGRSIVAVVMGGRTGARRNAAMTKMIARYLPKASRGKDRSVVVAAKSSLSKSVAMWKLAKTPIPEFAPRTAVRASAMALVATTPRNTQPVDNVIVPKAEATAAVAKPSAPAPSGWHIQLAAGDNKSELEAMLGRVQKKNRKMLGDNSLHLPTVRKNGATLYRARFTGFDGKRDAQRTCKALKRQRIACYAMAG